MRLVPTLLPALLIAVTVSLSACSAPAAPAPSGYSAEMDALIAEIDADAWALSEKEGINYGEAINHIIADGILSDRFELMPPTEYYTVESVLTLICEEIIDRPKTAGSLAEVREQILAAELAMPDAVLALHSAVYETGDPADTADLSWVVTSGFATADEAAAAGFPSTNTWAVPAAWAGMLPEPTGMTVTKIRFSVDLTGKIREADITATDTTVAAVEAWMASLPDVHITGNTSYFENEGDFSINLSSGGNASGVTALPDSWWSTLPLGPPGTLYKFAGVSYVVDFTGSTPPAPIFILQLDASNRIDVYQRWLETEAPGDWEVIASQDGYFSETNGDFEVQGTSQGDGTDELRITAQSWEASGIADLRP